MRKLLITLGFGICACSAAVVGVVVGAREGGNGADTAAPTVVEVASGDLPLPWCPPAELAIRCIEDWALGEIAAERVEPESFLAAIGVRMLVDTSTNSGCHDFWHRVAEELGKRFEPGLLFGSVPYNCSGAFFHGAGLGSALGRDVEGFANAVDGLCDRFVGGPRVIHLDCIHSIGHGFGALMEFPSVLTMCNRYARDDEELYWCGWGATESGLQNRYGEGEARYNKSVDDLDLRLERGEIYRVLDECSATIEGPLRRACYKLTLRLLPTIGEPYADIAAWCGAQDGVRVADCAEAAGELAAIEWLRGKAGMYDACIKHTGEGVACTLGFARPIARVDEWDDRFGLVGAEQAPAGERMSGCDQVYVEYRDICEREDRYTRDIELSPSELAAMDAAALPGLRAKMPAYATQPTFRYPDGTEYQFE